MLPTNFFGGKQFFIDTNDPLAKIDDHQYNEFFSVAKMVKNILKRENNDDQRWIKLKYILQKELPRYFPDQMLNSDYDFFRALSEMILIFNTYSFFSLRHAMAFIDHNTRKNVIENARKRKYLLVEGRTFPSEVSKNKPVKGSNVFGFLMQLACAHQYYLSIKNEDRDNFTFKWLDPRYKALSTYIELINSKNSNEILYHKHMKDLINNFYEIVYQLEYNQRDGYCKFFSQIRDKLTKERQKQCILSSEIFQFFHFTQFGIHIVKGIYMPMDTFSLNIFHRAFFDLNSETTVNGIDFCEFLFNTKRNLRNSVENVQKFFKFCENYLEIIQDIDFKSNENLVYHRMSSLIFHDMYAWEYDKAKSLILETTQQVEVATYGNQHKVKIFRRTESYYIYSLLIIDLIKYAPSCFFLESEELRYLNFMSFFSNGILIGELSLFGAIMVSHLFHFLIFNSSFRIFLPQALEKFLLFLITIQMKFEIKDKSILHPFYQFIISQVNPTSLWPDNEYFFMYLFSTDIVAYKSDILKISDPEKAMANILKIIKVFKNRMNYEKLVYLKMFSWYFDCNDFSRMLVHSEMFKNKFSKLISKWIYTEIFDFSISGINFYSVLKYSLKVLFFEVINKLNFQIKEYFKLHKVEKYHSFSEFIGYLSNKASQEIVSNSLISCNLFTCQYIIESFIRRLKSNEYKDKRKTHSNDCNEITFEAFLQGNIKTITKSLIYSTSRKGELNLDPDVTRVILLTELNANVMHNDHMKQSVIDNLIFLGLYLDQLSCFLIKENIFNFVDANKSKYAIYNYLNFLINLQTKESTLRTLSIIKFIERYFDYLQKTIVHILPEKYKKKNVSRITEEFCAFLFSNDNHVINTFCKNKTDLQSIWDLIENIKTGMSIWQDVFTHINKDQIVLVLSRMNCNKTCLNFIEQVIFHEMRTLNIRKMEDYPNDILLNKFYECYSKIDDNDSIMKSYFLNEELKKKVQGVTQNVCLTSDIETFRIFSEEFFSTGNFDLLDNKLQAFKNMELPYDLYLERISMQFISKINQIRISRDADEFLELSGSLRIVFERTIFKILNGTVSEKYGLFSQNKIYYELLLIFQSISRYMEQKFSSSKIMTNDRDTGTEDLLVSLVKKRVLSLCMNNLLSFKIRRIFASIYDCKRIEQKILQDIMKIYKQAKDDENLKRYFTLFLANFEKKMEHSDFYTAMKYSIYFRQATQFERYFDIWNQKSRITIHNDSNDYKLHIMNYKNMELLGYSYEYICHIIKTQVIDEMDKLPTDFVCGCINLYNEFLQISLQINPSTDIERLEKEKLAEFLTVIEYMAVICQRSNKKGMILKLLPRTINYLYKLQRLSTVPYESIANIIKGIKNENIECIIPQLLISYALTENSVMYSLAVDLLARFADEKIHLSAYWLAAFLTSQKSDLINYQKPGKKNPEPDKETDRYATLYHMSNTFGEKIYARLSSENKKIIDNYKAFQILLKKIFQDSRNAGIDDKIVLKYKNNIKGYFNEINRLISNGAKIILPTMSNMRTEFGKEDDTFDGYLSQSLRLDCMDRLDCNSQREYIAKVDEYFEIISSKERPLKIKFLLYGNIEHCFLLKGDVLDIMKELKSAEVFKAINEILSISGLNRNFSIYLKQYNLVPISSHIALIEWLNGTDTLKNCIDDEYARYGIPVPVPEKDKGRDYKLYDNSHENLNILYSRYLKNFPDPNKWYEAKHRYIISTAVWSMTGFLIGLGDRHIQNILIDNQGEVIHIDFGYVLGRGKTLQYPEIADFRYTKNIRRNLGVMEENGSFIFICEKMLNVFIKYFDTLFSKIEYFIFEPLSKVNDRVKMQNHIDQIKYIFSWLKQSNSKEFAYKLCLKNSNDTSLREMYVGWKPWC